MNVPTKKKRVRALGDDRKQEVHDAFHLFDTSQSGFLEYRELKCAMRALGLQVSKSEVLQLIETYGKNERKAIGFDDYFDVVKDMLVRKDPRDDVNAAFQLFLDYYPNSEKISVQHLRRVAQELGEKISEEDLEAMISEFDVDGDGMIDREEFLTIMLGGSNF